MEQHLRGEYKAAAAGGKLYAFINAMQKAGVCCRKQHCQGNTYQFRFYAKHCKTVQELAQANGVQLELTPCRTLQSFLYRISKLSYNIGIITTHFIPINICIDILIDTSSIQCSEASESITRE